MKAAQHPRYAPKCYELTSNNVSSYNTGCFCMTVQFSFSLVQFILFTLGYSIYIVYVNIGIK